MRKPMCFVRPVMLLGLPPAGFGYLMALEAGQIEYGCQPGNSLRDFPASETEPGPRTFLPFCPGVPPRVLSHPHVGILSYNRRGWTSILKWLHRRLGREQTPREKKPGRPEGSGEARISTNLSVNLNALKEEFKGSSDFVTKEFHIGGSTKSPAAVAYLSGMADERLIESTLITPLMIWARPAFTGSITLRETVTEVRSKLTPALNVLEVQTLDDAIFQILKGDTVLFIQGYPAALGAEAKGFPKRSVEDPQVEVAIRGPREGFTETAKDNVALIRKRLLTPKLVVEQMRIGRKSKTDIRVLYMRDIANPRLVDEVRRRVKSIEIDAVAESGILEALISDHPHSSFPVTQATERPDTVAASLIEGRVAIVTGNSSFLILVPMSFYHSFISAEDYYLKPMISIIIRTSRLLAFFVSTFITATYIALTSFHQELIPLPLLLNVAATEAGVPFPVFVNAIIIETLLEVLREAGIRLPKQVGQAVSIVGAIVLGQAAVQAGFASPGLVIVAALGTIASFAIPSYETATSVRLLRFPIIILASIYGLFGVAIGATALLFHLCSLKSFGVPYLSFGAYYPWAPEIRLRRRERPYGAKDRIRRGSFPDAEDPGPITGDEP